MTDETITAAVIARHGDAFMRGDIPAIMADYAEDAVLMTKATGVVKGKAAIEGLFKMIFESVFPPASTNLIFELAIISGNCGLLHWSATTPTARTSGAFDSFFIANGKIIAQTGGVDFLPRDAA